MTLSLLVLCSVVANGQEELQGVFSNEAEGFKVLTLMVHNSGKAYVHGGVAGVIGEWSYDKSSSILTFDFFDPGSGKHASLVFMFDPQNRSYTLKKDNAETRSDSFSILRHITDSIPDELIEAFEKYPEELERLRHQIEARERQEREYQEKVERERPDYEMIRESIIEDPRIIISEKFHSRDNTPATRALRSALGDKDISFPEDVLVDLLEEPPLVNHWLRKLIFSRPELSSETLERFYAQALAWGRRQDSRILSNYVKHPNTHRALVESLATMNPGAVGAAQQQIRMYAEEIIASPGTSSDEFQHLYEIAMKMPRVGHTDNGRFIILMLARNPNTRASLLKQIAKTDDTVVQEAVVSNPNTSSSTIEQLSTSRFPRVREAVVKMPEIATGILIILSKDNDSRVRAAVAGNPATPVETLSDMRFDQDFRVKRNLIRNSNTPIEVLQKHATDEHNIIRGEANAYLRMRKRQIEESESGNK